MKLTGAAKTATDIQREPRSTGRQEADRPLRRSLQGKILSRALLISIVPLLLIASVTLGSLLGLSRSTDASLGSSRDDLLRNVVGGNAREDAVAVMRQVERHMAERIGNVIDWSGSPTIYYAAVQAAEREGDALRGLSIADVERQYSSERRLSPGSVAERYMRTVAERQPMFAELFFTDRNGFTVGGSSRTSDMVQRDEDWWQKAWTHGLYVGTVLRDEAAEDYGVAVAVRINHPQRERPVGVMKAIISLNVLQQTATDIANKSNTEVSLLTRNELLLAETASDHERTRIMNPTMRFGGETGDAFRAALASINPGYILQEEGVAGYMSLISTEGDLWTMLENAGIDERVIDWVAVVQDSNEDALAPLAGLSDVQDGVTSTGRTFVILGLLALLAAVLAAFVVSTRLANGIVRPLRALRRTAHDIADRQLPALIEQVQHSESDEDLPTVPSVELDTDDEVEDVADAFNVVRRTAVELAAEQARSRRNVSRMFVSLGRRNQGLLSRQLEFIDRLESEESNPELLDNLFRLDHLATRMRRNAESLLVLAGEQPSRRWSEPVSLTDVVRGAVAEVEDYQRVNLEGIDEAQLSGSAVGDVSHLLAELIENATHFSPPDSSVMVLGRRVTDGYALAIVDDGVGMTEEQLQAANERIEASPQIERVPSSYLGLFVVGRLAARHDIKVRLVESTTEGVTAKVLLPSSLVEPLPLDWTGGGVSGGEPRTFDDHAIPVSVGGPRNPAVEVAEHESAAYSAPSTGFQQPPPSRPAEPVPVSDDTADLPGLGVRRRSSKRGGGDGRGDSAGRASGDGRGDSAGRASGDGWGDSPGRDVARMSDPDEGDGARAPQPYEVGAADGPPYDRSLSNGRGDYLRTPAEEFDDTRPPGFDDTRPPGFDDTRPPGFDDTRPPGNEPPPDTRPTRPPGDSSPRVFEVQRRASKRTDKGNVDSRTQRDRTVLRMEPSSGGGAPQPQPSVASNDPSSSDAERNAQAAKERLARFQRAVRQGRAQTGGPLSSAERNGGDRRDA